MLDHLYQHCARHSIKYYITVQSKIYILRILCFSDPSLAGGDTLTCGDCKRDFKLQELTLFIQHKAQNACKKLKLQTSFESDVNDKVKSNSSPKDRSNYVSLGSPSVSGSGKKCFLAPTGALGMAISVCLSRS